MSRYINMEKVLSELCLSHKDIIYIDKNEIAERIRKIPSIDIEPKRGKPDFADCEKCSRTYGTFGCCSTVSNEWVYSCLEGMLEKAYADGIKSVEPKRAKWIDNRGASDKSQLFPFECSECHDDNERTTNFCPNCGADMRGKGDE